MVGWSLLGSLCSFLLLAKLAYSSVRSLGVSEVAVGKGVFCGLLPASLGWHVHPSIDGSAGRVLAAQCDAEAEWMQWVLGGCSCVLVVSPSWLSRSNWLVNSFFVLVVGLAGVWVCIGDGFLGVLWFWVAELQHIGAEGNWQTVMASNQLQVLNALDVAKTQWYHFTAIVIAGMGFFTDSYDLFSISVVTKLLGRLYYQVPGTPKPGVLPINVNASVSGIALCGAFAGQLFFGWLGDKLGRKKVYGVTLIMMVICSLASGFSFGHSAKAVISTLCFFRFWLGFGIGGDYPLPATIMSEYANKKTRGAFIAAVFAMQGFGILVGRIVGLIVSAGFERHYHSPSYQEDPVLSCPPNADYIWRTILMFGAVPAGLTYYWRMQMPETARYTALITKNAKKAAEDMSKVLQVDITAEPEKLEQLDSQHQNFGLFSWEFIRIYGLRLLGTCSTWFLLGIAFYSQNLFQKDFFF
ncbi:Probable inorganic phosphate transporter 1-5 [Ancistrocladus abbreviatus]